MQITPLAADSMGCRSMATFVETPSLKILIDPGAVISPKRDGLQPHPVERWRLEKQKERIALFAGSSDVIVVTHYHPEHFMSDNTEIYSGKILLLKNPNHQINFSQRKTAFSFLQTLQKISGEISYVDGREIHVGDTRFNFSSPFTHREDDEEGFALLVAIHEKGHSFLFTSDVSGFDGTTTTDFVVEQNPEFIYLDGPETFEQSDPKRLAGQIGEIVRIIENTQVTKIIIDHHLTRDLNWKEMIEPVYNAARSRVVVVQSAAEFRGERNELMEARRKQLYAYDFSGKPKNQSQ